jgi:hypothetical protein
MIWALFFVAVFGPGALAGTMAIALHSIGFTGKFLSEAIEEAKPGPIEALIATGASPLAILLKGYWPQIKPAFLSISMFRWDINVRESAVLGLVGGGGLGMALDTALSNLYWDQAGLVLFVNRGGHRRRNRYRVAPVADDLSNGARLHSRPRRRSGASGRELQPAHFNWSATLARPAMAHFSSPSELDPLTPTAPIVSLPTLIGTPPRSAMTSASSRWAASSGISVVRFAHSALVRPKVRAV